MYLFNSIFIHYLVICIYFLQCHPYIVNIFSICQNIVAIPTTSFYISGRALKFFTHNNSAPHYRETIVEILSVHKRVIGGGGALGVFNLHSVGCSFPLGEVDLAGVKLADPIITWDVALSFI